MSQNNILNIQLKYNRIIVFFYCLLILFLPISTALVEIMAATVIVLYLVKRIKLHFEQSRIGQRRSWLEIFIPENAAGMDGFQKAVLIYLGCVLISVCFSQYPADSWIAFFGKLMEGYSLYVIFVDCVRTGTHFRNCLAVSVAAVLLMSLDGLFQLCFGFDFLRQLPLGANRVSATFRHANDFGAYLIMYIPLIFGLLTLSFLKGVSFENQWRRGVLGADKFSKSGLALIFLLMIVCLGLTFSRGSWVGFWLSMFFYAFFMRKYFFRVVFVSMIFLAIFLPFLIKYRDVSFTTDSVTLKRDFGNIERTPENLSKLTEVQRERVELAHSFNLGMGRMGFWEDASGIIKKYPLFGSGLNTYSKRISAYAHNCYLQMAAETGLVGLMAFLAMIIVLIWQGCRELKLLKDPYFRTLLSGCLAGLIGYLIQSFFDTTLYSVQLGNLLWVGIGFIVAIPRIARSVE